MLLMPKASATSSSDNYFQVTNSLAISRADSNDQTLTVNITDHWKSYITDLAKIQPCYDISAELFANAAMSFQQAQESGSWAVSTLSPEAIKVLWSPYRMTLDWIHYGPNASVGIQNNVPIYGGIVSKSPATMGCNGDAVFRPYATGSNTLANLSESIGWVPNDQLTISAKSEGSWRSYVFTGNPNYPVGYEGAPVRTSEPPLRYVAMGDSFSSGEGNPPFEAGTDTGSNTCHRSTQAYPRLLQNDPGLNLGPVAFVACSGATTANVLGGQNGEPAQINALSSDTKVVTITIGGNDVGFKEYAEHCIKDKLTSCGPGTGSYQTVVNAINNPVFLHDLENTYRTILNDAPSADVYVVDYPYLFGREGSYINCTYADSSGAYSVQSLLNSTVALAVANVRSEDSRFQDRLKYANTNLLNSPFADQFLCTDNQSGAAFNPVYLNPDIQSWGLHPNTLGHQDFVQIMKGVMN